MEGTIITINDNEYIQTYKNGNRILTQEKNKRGFKTKVIMSGTLQDVEDFKLFIVNIISKTY